MESYEKLKEYEKRRYESGLCESQKMLNEAKAKDTWEFIINIHEECIQLELDNLENLDDATINIIAKKCKSIIESVQNIYDQYLNDYYSRFDDLVRFHFGDSYLDKGNYYAENLLSSTTHHARLGDRGFADLDDIRNCFSGKNPYDENTIEGWINYVNACYGINLISDTQFNRIKEEYDKNRTDDEIYVKYREAERNAGKMELGALLIHDDRYLQAKENMSNLSL